MKKALFIFCCLLIPLQLSAYDKTRGVSPQMEAQEAARAGRTKSIELIEGTPARNFIKLEPVWACEDTMQGAIKKIKKAAMKLGADAIIEFKYSTASGGSAGGGAFGIYAGGGDKPKPLASGWAVKWAD